MKWKNLFNQRLSFTVASNAVAMRIGLFEYLVPTAREGPVLLNARNASHGHSHHNFAKASTTLRACEVTAFDSIVMTTRSLRFQDRMGMGS
jgi:hypothetical protein